MNKKEKALDLVNRFGKKIAIEFVREIKDNHPHKIVEVEGVFSLCSNEFFWEGVSKEIEKITII